MLQVQQIDRVVEVVDEAVKGISQQKDAHAKHMHGIVLAQKINEYVMVCKKLEFKIALSSVSVT